MIITLIIWLILGNASYWAVKNTLENNFFDDTKLEFEPIACFAFTYCGFVSAILAIMIWLSFKENK